MPRHCTTLLAALLVLGVAGCSDDSTSNINCDSDQLYDQVNKTCVPRGGLREADADDGDNGDATLTDAGSDAGAQDPDARDTGSSQHDGGDAADTADAIDMEACDKDRDDAIAEECGGYDCDDDNPMRSPYLTEFCDEIDNNCSQRVNDNINCSFYAHAEQKLYEVDPFAKKATLISENLPDPYLQDIDTHPDGTLFGITSQTLYRMDPWANGWVPQGDFGIDVGDPNGMAIDSTGAAYITSQDEVYTVDLMTGRATSLGSTGNFYSSGDCVVDKQDTLYMTSKEEGKPDELVRISQSTGVGTVVGEVGFEQVFSLTAAWGKLYGLTYGGDLIEINQQSGAGTLVHSFNGIKFWGAASTPNR